MNDRRYKWVLYTIVVVILVTISIQVYWNYKNYQTSKRQLINDVQISLDKAVDDYYADLAERTTFSVFFENDKKIGDLKENQKLSNLLKNIKESDKEFTNLNDIEPNTIDGITIIKGLKADSLMLQKRIKNNKHLFTEPKQSDSLKASKIEMLTSKVMFSINNDSINLIKLDSLLYNELTRKQLNVDFVLHFKNENFFKNFLEKKASPTTPTFSEDSEILSTTSKSTFLPDNSTLQIDFSNTTKVILKRILGGLLISTLLILAVISILFYLLKIIRDQKQLAEVKNDLISNITHEFKTPIATISAAIESINNFNAIEDKEKTKKYLNMSSEQLGKLNIMVEKMLETATLDSNNLELKKENFNLSELLVTLTNRYKIQFPEKAIRCNSQLENVIVFADLFHIENALNNILDNAIKYGGEEITITFKTNKTHSTILISDNGNSLTKTNKAQIFDKFYRVPKGNQHDVKGFGIGLYYTKTIIEKHKGSIDLELNKNLTTFKITLPNG
ncbi:HAMP domain-containing histidine kinase [Winogradskyella eckloniae]|uniref:sensor histidine kinase n=1 Tax=Winogradskyella eckloniae TaxID=1089306 RepID=UPI0015668897|nr:HAMP domain-containing sensor histidine kinase [Winogradskyella eckloniae]NRD21297.1 HAMP domain-containing histidine kinase [Winogradskyella eckloniae]